MRLITLGQRGEERKRNEGKSEEGGCENVRLAGCSEIVPRSGDVSEGRVSLSVFPQHPSPQTLVPP